MHLSSLRLGNFHLPIYGIYAALGLMSVLGLSQITARLARLDPDKVWDSVVSIGIATLVVSRVLLVMGSLRFFLQQPLLVLSLPTVNDTGLLLAAAFAMVYLRWKRLPPLRFLDALTPCGALLWASLNLGRWAGGTREGMPLRSGVWPVELLATFAAVSLCGFLLRAMRHERPKGRICALGLVAAGAAIFALAFLRLPADLDGAGILDPVQWMGLAMVVAGAALVIATPAVETGSIDAI